MLEGNRVRRRKKRKIEMPYKLLHIEKSDDSLYTNRRKFAKGRKSLVENKGERIKRHETRIQRVSDIGCRRILKLLKLHSLETCR